ncbi:MAG TPA: tetratricopeptide repeat protein [Candidatus Saccharimonadales bacterium]|nr:tetratricopeptide repeat protein [Candidatus Saccharimonadales bacterium]
MSRTLRHGWVLLFLFGVADLRLSGAGVGLSLSNRPAPVVITNSTPAVGTNSAPVRGITSALSNGPAPAVVTNSAPATGVTSALSNAPAPEMGSLPTPGALAPAQIAEQDRVQKFQLQLDLGKEQRRQKNCVLATQTLSGILEADAPPELQRLALFELALAAQDDNKLVRAEQIFSQYTHLYSSDPSVPEVLLRQGMIYRQMGVNTFAISKFYAVMSTALKLKLDNMDYYRKLVLQAQVEIADTYYMEGKYEESSDFFSRLLKAGNAELNQAQTQFKLVRSLSFLTNNTETVAQSQTFLDVYTNSADVPEVRFLLASSLKKLGRNNDAMKQVLLLLQSQQDNVHKNPETWAYWQRRAGNEIANQMYKEGDYFNSLQIYLNLADLDKSPTWQLPVWYQTALIYEQLQQWEKATETYTRILDRQKEMTDTNSTPSILSLFEMAKWRKDYISWMQKAKLANQDFVLNPPPTNSPTPLTP